MKSKLFLVLLSVGALCVLLSGCPPVVAPTIPAEKSSDKAILSFSFATPAAEGATSETAHTVSVQVPAGTALTALVPTITVSPGATVDPASGVAQDFTAVVNYTVTAEDGTTQGYAVAVYHAVPRDGLVGEWLFAGNANDTSGSGHDGTVGAGATLADDRFGVANSAYHFDGGETAQIIANGVGVNTAVDALNSISLWFSGDSGFNNVMPFAWESNYDVYMANGNIGFNTGNGDLIGVTAATPAGAWFHLVAVFFNGVPDPGNTALYINGVLQSSSVIQSPTVTVPTMLATAKVFISGWSVNATENHSFLGSIDDVRIYDRALTQEEVEELYLSSE